LRYGLFNAVVMSLADEKYLLTVMTDITMRKRAEEALRESEASRREQEALAKAGEERLILLDNIQTQVWYLTDDHTYGRVNAAHAAFIGVRKKDLAFRSLYDVFPQEVAELCRKGNSEVFHTGKKMHSEEWVPHFSGARRLLSILRAPILGNDGSVQQIVCSADDITERKRTVEALRESEERYRSLVENANEAIYVAQNGGLKFINRAGFEIAGYSEQDIPSIPFIDVIHPDDRAMMKERYQKRIAGETFESRYEFRIISKNGEIKWLELNAALINFEGKPATLNFVRDITKRKQSEALLILREEESIMLAKNLEEANIALRVVLSRREGDQKIFDEKIQLNVNEIILPFISSLKSSPLQTRDKHYLDLLEANLKSILSPFLRNMSNTYKNLTPKETQITEMIRQGYNSKDIADMLGTSVTTINTHRNNIRKKLNMKNQKTNLRSHLRSFS
jgi:PAS domain S-box-containing protein